MHESDLGSETLNLLPNPEDGIELKTFPAAKKATK